MSDRATQTVPPGVGARFVLGVAGLYNGLLVDRGSRWDTASVARRCRRQETMRPEALEVGIERSRVLVVGVRVATVGISEATPIHPGWHEPGTTLEFGFNRKAYEALPVDLRRILDHAAAATRIYGRSEYEAKNAFALEKLKSEFRGKVEILQLPAPVLRDLKKLAAEVVREESDKSPMARKVYASYTKFQAQHTGWSHVSEGAYQQFVAL